VFYFVDFVLLCASGRRPAGVRRPADNSFSLHSAGTILKFSGAV